MALDSIQQVGEPQPLEDVRRLYGRSRKAIYALIREFDLTKYKVPGDPRTYLDPDEVAKALTPRPKRGS